jgi:hypothetical protein
VLIVNEGGILDGHCKMEKGVALEEEPHPRASDVDRPLSVS